MSIDDFIQYGSMLIALGALSIGYKGMKPFIPVAMFASLYSNLFCFIAMYFDWWDFPSRIFPVIDIPWWI